MDSDPDKTFILSGIAHGFHPVNDLSIVSPADCHNYRSAENPAVKPALDKLFQDELCFHRIEEVFHKPLRVNAIGSVTKKDTGEPRPITDMSRPLNNSVNDYIYPVNLIATNLLMMPLLSCAQTASSPQLTLNLPIDGFPFIPLIAHFKDSTGLLMVLTNSLPTIFFVLVSKMRQVFFTGFPVRSRV